MPYLTKVQFCLPSKDKNFEEQFRHFLSPLGEVTTNGINLALSNKDVLPKTSFVFEGSEHPFMLFMFDDSGSTKVEITNTTGATKQSPYRYAHMTLEELVERIRPFRLQGLDHTGFNLPSFEGVHPKILELRQELKDTCLYHTFPKHLEDAPWDFILPGTQEEINGSQKTDYRHVRKPKLEIVSFENSSTPLLQIDIQVQGNYEDMVKVFPEALHVPEIRNMWVYLQNDFGIDVCFVLNEASENDWSYQFRNDRLR
jgi:hypothetical protein